MRLLAIVALLLSFARPAVAQLAPPNSAGVTYGHVHLNVRDIEVHKKLWVDHFGGTVVQKGPLTAVRLPNMLVALRQAEPTGTAEGTALDHIGFKVRSRAAFLKRWRAAGYAVEREFTGSEGFPNAYIVAPDNLRIELQEDTTLPVEAAAHHLHFMLPDHLKLREWYVELFSMTTRLRGSIDAADVPGMNLSFSTAPKPPATGTRGRLVDHIGFEVTNLEAFVKKLEARGIKFDVPFRHAPSVELYAAFLTDPSGVYIELTEGYAKY
jgi:catechol 2,3-dioxygenase-like lactoylglutathione lyase family enzyme